MFSTLFGKKDLFIGQKSLCKSETTQIHSEFPLGACVADANVYRQKHIDTPDIVYDEQLARKSQEYAEKLIDDVVQQRENGLKVKLTHDSNNDRDGNGENLAYENHYIAGGLGVFCKRANQMW